MRAVLLLLLVALLAHWPQLSLPEWRGTEGRRVQIAVEMAQSGDLLVPTLSHEPTLAKPPLHYWLLAGVERILGDGFVALRLPSVLAFWLLAVLAFALIGRSFGRPAAWTAALGVLLAPVGIFTTASTEIDPTFAALTAGSLLALAHGVGFQRRGVVLLGGVLGGLAMLHKGPPYFLFAAGAWLVWWRHRRLRFGLSYFVPLLLLPLLYFVPLLLLRVSFDEFSRIAKEESIGRAALFTWKHVTETPEYWLRGAVMLLPFAFWSTWEFRGARDARMGPVDLQQRMATSAVVFALVLFTFFPARPTRYLLPNVPLFVCAMAPAVAHYAGQRQLGGFSRRVLWLLGVLGAGGLVAGPWLLPTTFTWTWALLLVLAALPLLVRTPRALVAACLWLPLLLSWTVGVDFARHWVDGPRGRSAAAPVLAAALAAHGADATNTRTFGHFNSCVAVPIGMLPPGEERATKAPESRFVLLEAGNGAPVDKLAAYRERVRVHLPSDTWVLYERR